MPKYESVNETSQPYSYVIIDNRPGKLFMAVEKSKTWRSDTNKVKELIQESLGGMLRENFNLDINIVEQTIPTKIWNFCESQCKDGKDSITEISFVLKNPNRIDPSNRLQSDFLPEFLKQAQAFTEQSGALTTTLSATYPNVQPTQLKEKVDDFVHLARTCTQQQYELRLKFKEFGVYRCDDQVVAIYPMQEGLITQFLLNMNNDLFGSNELENWFDTNIKELERIRNANTAPAPRHRKN